jgi:hypothetical protein
MSTYQLINIGSDIDKAVTNANIMLATGVSDPVGSGELGQLYLNTITGILYQYSSDGWGEFTASGGGHIILNSSGVTLDQQPKLKFVNATVTDDNINGVTVVTTHGATGPQGPPGDDGPQGETGPQGKNLEFNWNGTQLGVRVEGDPSYQYVNLKGDKGTTGDTGATGRGITSVTRTSGNGSAGTTDTYTIAYSDSTISQFYVYNGADGQGSGDMTKTVYDTNNNGIVDNAEKVNGHTVLSDVPANAKFTDTVTTINDKTGAIAKSDITALGIPAQDTVYTHPATHSADIIVDGTTNKAYTATEQSKLAGIETGANKTTIANNLTTTIAGSALDATQGKELADLVSTHTESANPHGTTKADVGLGNVDDVKQMPIAGGTFTGVAVAQTNTSYTTRQLRNVILSTSDPSGGSNGDIWIKYT